MRSLKNENITSKAKNARDLIKEYKTGGNITKEDVTKRISEIRNTSDANKEKYSKKKLDAINKLESELKDRLLETVKGYENNPDHQCGLGLSEWNTGYYINCK